jgi:Mg-chelatase subunit ChlD
MSETWVRAWDVSEEGEQVASYLVELRARGEAEVRAMDVVFVLDISSSMRGAPLDAVKAAVRQMLGLLSEEDRVGVVLFDASARVLAPLTELSSGRRWLESALEGVDSGCGTNMEAGVMAALDLWTGRGERPALMVVLSDGEVVLGERSSKVLAKRVRRRHREVTVSTLGFGVSHDEELMHGLASELGGVYRYIARGGEVGRHFAAALGAARAVIARDVALSFRAVDPVELIGTIASGGRRRGGDHARRVVAAMLEGQRELMCVRARRRSGARWVLEVGSEEVERGFLGGCERGGEEERELRWVLVLGEAERRAGALLKAGQASLAREALAEALEQIEAHRRLGWAALERAREEIEELLARLQDSTQHRAVTLGLYAGESRVSEVVCVGHYRATNSVSLGRDVYQGFAPVILSHVEAPAGSEAQEWGGTRLIVEGAEVKGRVVELPYEQGLMLFGRSSKCDVQVEEEQVSRIHLRVLCDARGWWLEDAGSSNGTRWNGRVVGRGGRTWIDPGVRHYVKLGPEAGLIVRVERTQAS